MTRLLILGLLGASCLAQTKEAGDVDLAHTSVALIEALRSTLSRHPSIRIQEQQVMLNRGVLQAFAGQFDPLFTAGVQQNKLESPLTAAQENQYKAAGLTAGSLSSKSTTYTANAQKLFRNGIGISPSLTLDRAIDNIGTRQGLSQSRFGFQVVVPLLRGRGREVVDAQELSSGSTVEASVLDVNQTIAQLLTTTAIQYWNAVGAARNEAIAAESEERGRNYVKDVQALIDADRVPKAEINQLIANLAGRTATRIQAEQGVITARQNLALAMGLGESEVNVQPGATDSLPDWTEGTLPRIDAETIDAFVGRASANRADLLAANLRRVAAEQLLPAARNQLRPQLNLNLNAGYSGLEEGPNYFRPFGAPFANVHGMNMTAALNYSFAPRNSLAAGQLAQAEASYRQTVLTQNDLKRNISSNVVTAMTTLVNGIAGLRKTRESVGSYRIALNGQQEKFRMGLGSLVDVLTMEDRLTSALAAELQAQVNYATALENLRYATGTVIDPRAQVHTIERETFLNPPFEWGLKK